MNVCVSLTETLKILFHYFIEIVLTQGGTLSQAKTFFQ